MKVLLRSDIRGVGRRGDIVEVRPGPVVTMYELEPASGIKASRVIQLADDIAVEDGYVRLPDVPGIGFETKNELYALMRDIAGQ